MQQLNERGSTTDNLVKLIAAPPRRPVIADSFEPFARLNSLKYRQDDKYFYVESNSMPDHRMMVELPLGSNKFRSISRTSARMLGAFLLYLSLPRILCQRKPIFSEEPLRWRLMGSPFSIQSRMTANRYPSCWRTG